MAKIEGRLVDFFVSTTVTPGAEVWNRIICSTDASLDGSVDTTSVNTKCGVQKARGNVGWTLTGSGQADSAPAAGQLSFDDILTMFQDGTQVAWKMEHLVDDTLVHRSGIGVFSAYAEAYGVEDNMSFDWTLEVDGDITTVAAA